MFQLKKQNKKLITTNGGHISCKIVSNFKGQYILSVVDFCERTVFQIIVNGSYIVNVKIKTLVLVYRFKG